LARERDKDRDRDRGDKEGRPLRKRRKKVCIFCAEKFMPDYKRVDLMRKFVSDRGKILTMRSSGCCASHQRAIATEIKRARQIGLLPYTVE
jgi:small subunit ribosomal protein S18